MIILFIGLFPVSSLWSGGFLVFSALKLTLLSITYLLDTVFFIGLVFFYLFVSVTFFFDFIGDGYLLFLLSSFFYFLPDFSLVFSSIFLPVITSAYDNIFSIFKFASSIDCLASSIVYAALFSLLELSSFCSSLYFSGIGPNWSDEASDKD